MKRKIFLTTLVFALNFPLISCADRNYQDIKDFTHNKHQGACNMYYSQSQLCADMAWLKTPTEQEQGSFDLKFYSKESLDQLISPNFDVFVLLWMPGMGHGSSPVTVSKLSEGHYRVSNVFFVMKGEWEIHIQIKDGDKLIEEVVEKINF